MVGDTGIEPVTSSVSGKRATAAPIARNRKNPEWIYVNLIHNRADDEIRTRDIHLGKVVLYQLSYVRNMKSMPAWPVVLHQASFLALVGDTGIEPVTSSVSGKRATAAPIAHFIRPKPDTMVFTEVGTGFEPVYTALQAAASPLGQPTV
jgi:hypothetical protein